MSKELIDHFIENKCPIVKEAYGLTFIFSIFDISKKTRFKYFTDIITMFNNNQSFFFRESSYNIIFDIHHNKILCNLKSNKAHTGKNILPLRNPLDIPLLMHKMILQYVRISEFDKNYYKFMNANVHILEKIFSLMNKSTHERINFYADDVINIINLFDPIDPSEIALFHKENEKDCLITQEKPEKLEESKKAEESSDTSICVVCWENKKEYAFNECGHMCLCSSCVCELNKKTDKLCPMCRTVSKKIIKIWC